MTDQATDEQQAPKPKRSPERPWTNIQLPREFKALCKREQIATTELIRQFVADVCDLRAWTTSSAFACSGDKAHRAALAYLEVVQQARRNKAQAGSLQAPSHEAM